MIGLDRMRALEANSEWQGVSRHLLMENAGAQVVRELLDRKKPEKGVIIFAGTGNNGGDGFVAARHLINQGVEVKLVLVGRPRNITTSEAEENWQTLSQMEKSVDFQIIQDSTDVQKVPETGFDVGIDAMLGTGISGAPREPFASVIEYLNQLGTYNVAVDIPTGVDPVTGEVEGNASECDLTVTFHDSKPGIEKANEENVGEIAVADIGIPSSASNQTGPGDVWMAMREREVGSHKGENGRVLIVGGGSRYVGAPALAGLSALRSGADLVTIAAPSDEADIVSSFSPDLITVKLSGEDLEPGGVSELGESLEKATSVIIGPGLGLKSVTEDAVVKLMDRLVGDFPDLPVLLDADGLKIVSENTDFLRGGNCVITPHTGEFELVSGSSLSQDEEERFSQVSDVAMDLGVPVLLKAHTDICADADGSVVLNKTGNAGMTVGGTGDVLSGIVGAFLSQGADLFRAISAGAFINGLAGDMCSQEKGYEFTASDVKDKIPIAISNARECW